MRTGSIVIRSARQAQKSIAIRGGGGGPLARPEAPSQPLGEQDELYVMRIFVVFLSLY
jgi:hypothetical protein